MAFGYKPSYTDFSWLGELPGIARERESEAEIKQAMSGVNFEDPASLRRTASALARTAGAKQTALANQLNEQATKLEEIQLGRYQGRVAAGIVGGGGPVGDDKITALGKRDPELPGLINAAAQKYSVTPGELANLTWSESRGRADAVGPPTRTGERAVGVTQLMPGTARDLGVTDRLDKGQSVDGGASYYSQMKQKYGGNIGLAYGAYNWGPGRVDDYLAGNPRPIPAETQKYVLQNTGKPLEYWKRLHQDPAERGSHDVSEMGRAYSQKVETPSAREAQLAAGQAQLSKAAPGAQKSMEIQHKALADQRTEENKLLTKEYLDYQKEVFKKRDAADQLTNSLNAVDTLLKAGVQTGWGAETVAKGLGLVGTLERVAREFGLPVPEAEIFRKSADINAKQEALRALANKVTLASLGGSLGNMISNPDRSFMEVANVSLANSPKANEAISVMTRAMAERDKLTSRWVADYFKSGGRDRAQIERYIADYNEANPLFVDKNGNNTALGQRIAAMGAAAPAPAAAPKAPAAPAGRLPQVRGPKGELYDYYGPGDLRPAGSGL